METNCGRDKVIDRKWQRETYWREMAVGDLTRVISNAIFTHISFAIAIWTVTLLIYFRQTGCAPRPTRIHKSPPLFQMIYPGDRELTERERTNICYLAFPDSNSGLMGNVQFHFRIRQCPQSNPLHTRPAIHQYNATCPTSIQVILLISVRARLAWAPSFITGSLSAQRRLLCNRPHLVIWLLIEYWVFTICEGRLRLWIFRYIKVKLYQDIFYG